MHVFSEFLKLAVRDNDTKNIIKYINGVGKAHCMLAFYKWGIKRNQASVASEKMIGRLYKANTFLSNLIFLPLIFPPPNFYENVHAFRSPFFFQNAG